jgi:methyl-accepting chemotaxis protein
VAGVFSILLTVEDTLQGIGQNQEAASELSNMAADLQKLVRQFKYS